MATAPEQSNISDDIEGIAENDASMSTFNHTNYSAELDEDQWEALAEALAHNTTIEELLLDNGGVETKYCLQICEALKTNKFMKVMDLKYNRFGVEGFLAISEMLKENTALEVVKCDFQKVLPGPDAERALAEIFKTNTTLLELRIKCREIECARQITIGEVRNKQIAKRKAAGKDWADLDPARRDEVAAAEAAVREAIKKAEEEEKAPITEKVEDTGGPYTYKELTCLIEYQPDDLDKKKKEQYLPDDEFLELFEATKEEYAGWPKWKKKNTKKRLNLH